MKRIKIHIWFLTVVICFLVLVTSCAPSAEKSAKPEVKPAEQKPELAVETAKVQPEEKAPKAEPKEQMPAVELTLKLTPQDSTTYKVITESQRNIKGEGALSDDSTFKGGTTSSRVEMTFTQQIKSIDDDGTAAAEITIKGLKCLTVVKNNTVLDFDSSRKADLNNSLGALIGQSYTIGITPAGEVIKIIDLTKALAVIKGSSSTDEAAKQILSPDSIKERHSIPALSACGKKRLQTGDNWSSVKTFSFGMMGSKSFERIYTLKEIKDVDNRRIAVIEMNAIPSAEMAEELHKEQSTGVLSKMFDSIDTYTGEIQFDLNAGKVKEYFENQRSEWTAVDPAAAQKDDKEPAALRMTATRSFHIEKID